MHETQCGPPWVHWLSSNRVVICCFDKLFPLLCNMLTNSFVPNSVFMLLACYMYIEFEREKEEERLKILLLIQNEKSVTTYFVSLFIEKTYVVTLNLTKAVN